MGMLGISLRPGRATKIKSCRWLPPIFAIKVNVDGASAGNPGAVGIEAIFRDSNGALLLILSQGIGHVSNFRAEGLALVAAG